MATKISNNVEDAVVKLYNEGYGTLELAEKFNLHRGTIQRILKRNNVDLRKRTPVHYDIHFFDEYNENSCYWAGFIAADGYIRSDRAAVTVHLANTDYKHLLKLAQITNYEGNINVSKDACYITFAGEWFKNSLIDKFDIHPRKTFNITISEKIPKDMVKHFLRGYFDGDGSVTYSDKYLRANFTSGSETLLNQIANYFYDNGVRVRNKENKPPICHYTINYGCTNALKVLSILYDCSSETNRLDRKYQLYLDNLKYKGDINEFSQ